MILLSIGDQVAPGCYSVHSRFARVLNFASGRTLVSLVDDSVGAGPLNIVVRNLRFEEGLKQTSHLCIDSGTLVFSGRQLQFSESQRYCSRFTVGNWRPLDFWQNFSFFRQLLAEAAKPNSLAFLIDEGRLKNFQTGFGRAFTQQITSGATVLFGGNLLKGAALLKGCGYGLTPAGDDFLAGLMIALNLLQQMERRDFRATLDALYPAALGDNILSNSFLYLARRGLVCERMRDFITSLLRGEVARVRTCSERLIAVGETSGADLATGFVMTLCNCAGAVMRGSDSAATATLPAAATEVGVA